MKQDKRSTWNLTKTRRKNHSNLCSVCPEVRDNPHRSYCLKCHAKYMRKWRKSHPLNDEQLFKARARAYARTYVIRGKLVKENCRKCGDKQSQMHHTDYSKPLAVIWLCRNCHLKTHRAMKKKSFH